MAIEGSARCHGLLGEYQLVIDLMNHAVEMMPESAKCLAGYLYACIVEWRSALGNKELTYEAAYNAFNMSNGNTGAQATYIMVLHSRGESEKIVDLLEWLNSVIDEGSSWLVCFFVSGEGAFDEIGKACREQGQPVWVLDAMDESLRITDSSDRALMKVWLPLWMAYFRYKFYDDRESEFIKLAEMFLYRLARATDDVRGSCDFETTHQKEITNLLAQIDFDNAVAAWDDGRGEASSNVFADKLKRLAVSVATSLSASYEGFDFFREDYPAMLWGRWLRDYKKGDEKVWRKCFKARLLREMNSLDDDDPTNDTDGLASLARTLFHAGDWKDVAAIMAILYKPLEDAMAKQKEQEAEAVEEGKKPPPLNNLQNISESIRQHLQAEPQAGAQLPSMTTDGEQAFVGPAEMALVPPTQPEKPGRGISLNITEDGCLFICDDCERDASEVAEMYFCEVCMGVNWCGECLAKLRDPTISPWLNQHLCNRKHATYRVWPIPDDARDLAADYFEGGIQLRREWLERLRGEWLRPG